MLYKTLTDLSLVLGFFKPFLKRGIAIARYNAVGRVELLFTLAKICS